LKPSEEVDHQYVQMDPGHERNSQEGIGRLPIEERENIGGKKVNGSRETEREFSVIAGYRAIRKIVFGECPQKRLTGGKGSYYHQAKRK